MSLARESEESGCHRVGSPDRDGRGSEIVIAPISARRMWARSGAATTHGQSDRHPGHQRAAERERVNRAGPAAGTISVVLFTDACITITSSRLPSVFQ